ncbi:triose-phosphate isomerase [Rubrimonas cliftonensis]|uniref:Triosephosphate isomerase n=1 Tax=Rubrimonas cliftonensis TaxID=89524 RepID=A0A1H3YJ17_9RHOB|nr:triose-phosphate isomerase [Rubrimonas cliftonensis]SEA11546.1 triosephosphate isomerase [Rubrimonas cliftonensis]
MARRKLIAGNWKMNGLRAAVAELDDVLDDAAGAACDLMLCPPATLVPVFASRAAGSPLVIGGQDCHARATGAHTGDIAAEMLADAGAKAVIVGHSERRADHGENDALVREKAEAAWRARLTAVICVGETEAERDAGRALEVVARSLAGSTPDTATAETTVIAYEPVWAIGSGRTPTLDEIAEMHAHIRAALREHLGEIQGIGVRVLYGGSVKPDNAAEILAVRGVDGALVGGASLKARDFLAIAGAV